MPRVTAKAARDVVEEGSSGAGAVGQTCAAKAVEGLNAEMLEKHVGGLVEFEGEGVVRRRGERECGDRGQMVRNEEFTRLEPGKLVGQVLGRCDFGQTEFTGTQVEPGEAGRFFVGADGDQIVVAVFLESEIVKSAGTEDAGDFAADEFARGDLADLVANGDTFAGFDQFGHISARAVAGDTAHGRPPALGQSDIEKDGRLAGIVEKQFVKVSEAEEEKRVGRETAADVLILAHHGGELGVRHEAANLATGTEDGNRRARSRPTYCACGRVLGSEEQVRTS